MDGYNETKAAAETAVMNANDNNGLRTVCLRPAGIFGPGDRQLVPGLRASAKLGQLKFQLGDNNNLFDWSYAGNVADAHVLAAQKVLDPETRDPISGETFLLPMIHQPTSGLWQELCGRVMVTSTITTSSCQDQ